MSFFDFLRGEEKPRVVSAGPVDAENEVKISMNKVAKLPDLSKGDTAIEKRIRWLINNPPEVPFVRANITPAFAAELLTYAPGEGDPYRQRPLNAARVKKYANMMLAGEWRETLVPIIFTKSGLNGDGQHRLNAVVEAQVTLPFWLAFGDDDKNFFVYDAGGIRTKGDIFAINGVPNATVMAAAIRWVFAYERGTTYGYGNFDRGGGQDISTNERAYNYFLLHPDLGRSMPVYSAWAAKRMPNPSVACALHYIAAQRCRSDADEFFNKAATGVGFTSQRDPAYKLRERLANGAEKSSAITAMLIIHAWNAMRTNKPVGRWPSAVGKLPRMA